MKIRSPRSEINVKNKYYFYDTGIRNGIINNFNKLDSRDDVGALFENFVIAERLKKHKYLRTFTNLYFWRTYSNGEIDLIEESQGEILSFEIKWNKIVKPPKLFFETYKNSTFEVITKENYLDFVI
ncbi:DUF4143 domain-containing protein [Caldisericum exile]|uniref:DUF4143 domain-containing protein n=1 Tax=Caldisericum exile (strain DSM 21853 / NBRC 104410 / AZM16c01) TaxID=511051 RepID=A0A7U6JF90_CALEA|nr:DUF4143 domain-containing protein [Caldisericum exile]BAL81546.1 hypothetical protein CSE_14200 [Caldisericum exile AZM16c01]